MAPGLAVNLTTPSQLCRSVQVMAPLDMIGASLLSTGSSRPQFLCSRTVSFYSKLFLPPNIYNIVHTDYPKAAFNSLCSRLRQTPRPPISQVIPFQFGLPPPLVEVFWINQPVTTILSL
ncbi:unnamed protein product [Hymenolepis diminuta]|uniref:Uncharacterized protein n=1 Tax=Hymenolepis diminuta TaxID=6216 RepID=A0A564YJQ4_HYMDI|nr:unnamed protein product [Hymenolepis diminuta]